MIVSLEEAKQYLKVDGVEEDALIQNIIHSAHRIVQDLTRLNDADFASASETVRIAVLYAIAYLFEHREEGYHKELMLDLRELLSGVREARF